MTRKPWAGDAVWGGQGGGIGVFRDYMGKLDATADVCAAGVLSPLWVPAYMLASQPTAAGVALSLLLLIFLGLPVSVGNEGVCVQLRRLDKPWEDFNHDLLVQAHLEARAIAAAEKERLEKEARKAAKKGRDSLPSRVYYSWECLCVTYTVTLGLRTFSSWSLGPSIEIARPNHARICVAAKLSKRLVQPGRFTWHVTSGKKVAAPKVAPKIRDVPTVYCAKVVRRTESDVFRRQQRVLRPCTLHDWHTAPHADSPFWAHTTVNFVPNGIRRWTPERL